MAWSCFVFEWLHSNGKRLDYKRKQTSENIFAISAYTQIAVRDRKSLSKAFRQLQIYLNAVVSFCSLSALLTIFYYQKRHSTDFGHIADRCTFVTRLAGLRLFAKTRF